MLRKSGASRPILLALATLLCAAGTGAAQDPDAIRRQLEESQSRLDEIRRERTTLETQLDNLSGQVHDVSEEITNIERQIAASASALVELDVQIGALLDQVTIMTRDWLLNRDRLTARRAVLNERLREIYKRGPLATFQVLLSSSSFADLINRYRYLHDVAMFDRLLVDEVTELESRLEVQRDQLANESDRIRRTRDERSLELDRLERLERQRQERLRSVASQQTQAQSRLTQLASEEEQLRGMIATLETRRREAERSVGVSSTPTLRTSDLGQLDWPVSGRILYGFGPQNDGSTTIFREGVGIAAPRGTPVQSIGAGSVVFAGARTSGQTVIVDHGGGYYSVYTRLQNLTVIEGQSVQQGQMIGRVGGEADSPHIELQIYEPSAGGPRVVDPVRWLRDRG
ncbi:MAG: peptidoglycan DD-metalloendopeptidase family protein [Gemmatimonadota bacterium]|nr:peptidoglycan DD-metalloendopeptidase family protein [Gemmatimonadota bacterium]